MLLLLFTAAVWWLANLFTLVMRGERLRGERDRGEEVFDWLDVRGGSLVGGWVSERRGDFLSVDPLSRKTGGFYSFQSCTASHRRAQQCTVVHSRCTVERSNAQSMHSRAQPCTVDAQQCTVVHSRCTVERSNAQSCTVELAAILKCPNIEI